MRLASDPPRRHMHKPTTHINRHIYTHTGAENISNDEKGKASATMSKAEEKAEQRSHTARTMYTLGRQWCSGVHSAKYEIVENIKEREK